MKKEYNIKDRVWIHLGEKDLVEGRVVEIIDLEHLGEGHSPDLELYVIEIKTGIDDVYEVRSFDQISPDKKGPIALFRKVSEDVKKAKRYLKKVGVQLPVEPPNHFLETVKEINESLEEEYPEDPTPEQIHAAIERAQEMAQHPPLKTKRQPKKRYFRKKVSKE